MLICRTPYRLSLFGGGTDYPPYYLEHGGAVISTTIDKYCYLSVRYLPPFFPDFKHRIVYSRIEDVQSIDEIQHPSVRECLKYIGIDRGIEINHAGDLPARSGIGSSSSFTVGLLNALHVLRNDKRTKKELALEAIHVEQELIKEACGSQDQVAAAYGGFNYIQFGNHQPIVTPIEVDAINEIQKYLLLVFTGFQRNANEVAKSYDFKNRGYELNEMGRLAKEAYQCLMNGSITKVGHLLHEQWLLKRRLSAQISTPYIDYVYDTAIKTGAIGGKVCGAGGGGFMMIFAEPDTHERIKTALKGMLFVPFKFEKGGSKIIVNNGELNG